MPAVIAKASAIYNPIIYAIIHPRYRYSKHIGMCTTVHAKVLFKINRQPPFLQPYPVQCMLQPMDAGGQTLPCVHLVQGGLNCMWSSRCGLKSGPQRVSVPPFTFLSPHISALMGLHVTTDNGRTWWCSGSSLAISAKEHSTDNGSQPVWPINHIITLMQMFKTWFSEASILVDFGKNSVGSK